MVQQNVQGWKDGVAEQQEGFGKNLGLADSPGQRVVGSREAVQNGLGSIPPCGRAPKHGRDGGGDGDMVHGGGGQVLGPGYSFEV